MAEYIEKDALLKELKDKCDYALSGYCWSGEYIMGFTHATDIVSKALPLNVAIVKHAEWKDNENSANYKVCNRCGRNVSIVDANLYCCNCGSKMHQTDEEVGEP